VPTNFKKVVRDTNAIDVKKLLPDFAKLALKFGSWSNAGCATGALNNTPGFNPGVDFYRII
jgi:hypothetical protein